MAKMVDMGTLPPSAPLLGSSEGARKPSYPSLYLDGEQLKRLGLSGCKVGDEHTLTAEVRVTAVSNSESEGGESYSSVTLSIVEAQLSAGDASPADRVYGDDE